MKNLSYDGVTSEKNYTSRWSSKYLVRLPDVRHDRTGLTSIIKVRHELPDLLNEAS